MFVFSGIVKTAYARNIIEWSTHLGQNYCSTFGEQYEREESEVFLAFVYVLTEKLHLTFSKSRPPEFFKRDIPAKIQSIRCRQHGAEISHARLVVAFDRMRQLIDKHLVGFLDAHHSSTLSALELHLIRIASVLYQQSFGRVVPHMAQYLEGLTRLFVSLTHDAKAFTMRH